MATSRDVRRLLGAISGEFDTQMETRGLDPQDLRKQFYSVYSIYSHTYKVVEDPREWVDDDGEFVDRMVIDLNKASCGSPRDSPWRWVVTRDHLIVERDPHNNFYVARGRWVEMYDDWDNEPFECGYDPDYEPEREWEEDSDYEPVDFVALLSRYHQLVVLVCEHFGFESVIGYMRG